MRDGGGEGECALDRGGPLGLEGLPSAKAVALSDRFGTLLESRRHPLRGIWCTGLVGREMSQVLEPDELHLLASRARLLHEFRRHFGMDDFVISSLGDEKWRTGGDASRRVQPHEALPWFRRGRIVENETFL